MQVKLHGELVDVDQDDAVRSHATVHGMLTVQSIPRKNRERAFEKLIADLYFCNVKLGALVAVHEIHKHEFVPLRELDEFLDVLRTLLGQPKPKALLIDALPSQSDPETAASAAEGH